MFRTQLPRIYELRDLISDPASPAAYFHDFEDRCQNWPNWMREFVSLEKELKGLNDDAWRFLKSEATPHLSGKDPNGRGWQQLFNFLNQAYAYNDLKDIVGCSSVCFIPRSAKQGKKTPDLQGLLGVGRVLCEVKTINASKDELRARRESTPRGIKSELKEAFFQKLRSRIATAKQQLYAHEAAASETRYVVYFNVCFDDFFGDYSEEYFQQIDQYLKGSLTTGIELFFRHDSPFAKPFAMTAATAVNRI
jgi:hypothetical protein